MMTLPKPLMAPVTKVTVVVATGGVGPTADGGVEVEPPPPPPPQADRPRVTAPTANRPNFRFDELMGNLSRL
jgi:hypothetical protein